MNLNRLLIIVLVGLPIMVGCQSGSGAGGSGRLRTQDPRQLERAQEEIQPTRQVVADANRGLLDEAVRGYIGKVFPIEIQEVGYIETKTVEWEHWKAPHRTRVTVEITDDPSNAKNAVINVVALRIEPVLALEDARTGVPLQYGWVLEGTRPEVEEVVAGQIMRRYLLLAEGRNPDEAPLEGPIPGMPEKVGYLAPGRSGK
jgi:hypothetical protein